MDGREYRRSQQEELERLAFRIGQLEWAVKELLWIVRKSDLDRFDSTSVDQAQRVLDEGKL